VAGFKTEFIMRDFIVFYEHTEYGYYSTTIDADDIVEALNFFAEEYAYNEIYGIMEKK
jgi:hypothetical protein